jgi:DNA-binding protein YbaB
MNEDPLQRLREAVESYPKRMAEATERVRELVGQTVTAGSTDGAVEVVAAGTGDIVSVRVLGDRRRLDSQTLSESVVEATNAALDAVDRLRASLLPGTADAQQSLADAEQAFTRRMDGLLSTLDRLGRELDAHLGTTDPGPAREPQ